MCVSNPTRECGSHGTHHVLRQAGVHGGSGGLEAHSQGKPPPLQVDPGWVPASRKICRGSSLFPSSHSFQVGWSSNACGPAANHAMCVSSLKNTSKPVIVCLQSSCIFGMLTSVLDLIPPALSEQPVTDLHTQTWNLAPQLGTWAWESQPYLFTQNPNWKICSVTWVRSHVS